MSKLVKETDLKSVGACPLEGSIPSSRIWEISLKVKQSAVNRCIKVRFFYFPFMLQ